MRIRSLLGCVALAAGIVAGVAPAGAESSRATPWSIELDRRQAGRLLWESRYLKGNIPVGLAVSPDGSRVYLTGSDCTGNLCQKHQDYSTGAYDAATGELLWVARFDGPGHGLDESHSLAISPDGAEVYVTGGSVNVDLISDFATIAYDAATGDQLWEARYRGPGEGAGADYGRRIAVDPSGATVYVTGPASGVGSGYDYTTLAYEASTGDQRWVAVYDGPTPEDDDIPQALMVSPDGSRVYVTGGGVGSVYDDFATVAYDAATGDQLWVDRYGSGGVETDLAVGLGASPDSSRVYVAGCSGGDTGCFGDSHWTTIAYDASGQRIWLKKFDGSAQGKDIVAGLEVSPDGSLVYVGGSSGPDYEFDFAIVAYDSATGRPQWKGRYAGDQGGDDIAYALAVAPDGSEVVVTGVTEGFPAGDATVAFDGTTGKPLWHALHPGEGADAVGFSPDSATVFVAGSLYRDGYAYDTLAYGA